MSAALHRPHQVSYSDKDEFIQAIALDKTLKSSATHLAVILVSFINRETGLAWPSQKRLADMSGLSERTVMRTLQELEIAGYILKEKGNGRGKNNRYSFNFESHQSAEVLQLRPVQSEEKKGDKSDRPSSEKGDKKNSKGCQKRHKKGDAGVTLTSINKTNNNNQYGLTQKFTKEELQNLALLSHDEPVSSIPQEQYPSEIIFITRHSEFWTDWLESIQLRHANPSEARKAVQKTVEVGWLPAKGPYPKHLSGTPRALAYDASSEFGLSEGTNG